MKVKHKGVMQGWEKEFLQRFDSLCYSLNAWEVWSDLMAVMACSISNAIDRTSEHIEAREREYERCIRHLNNFDVVTEIFGIVVQALEDNPFQDFLGKMYMNLNLGSHWHGQFFTPYHVSELMAKMLMPNAQEEMERRGWISICDPTVGGGGMLIAAASALKEQNINYQTSALFVGQDIDRVVAQMAYIQISLLGCPGYIAVGNSLTNPMSGPVLFPQESDGIELWITPMFASDIWQGRRIWAQMDNLISGAATATKSRGKEQLTYFFNFEQEEAL